MARRQQTRGKCAYCGREMTNGGMRRHLPACPARQEKWETAVLPQSKPETLHHIQIQDKWTKDFWLHLEMRGLATLRDLDRYLRAIWLECCGHLSMFSTGGWGSHEFDMSTKISRALQRSEELSHIYDFGTSSHTQIRLVKTRQGKPTGKHPIVLMARNNMPEYPCMKCGEKAAWMCMECMYEDDESGLLCDRHVEDHPHQNYGPPTELYNSPRVGMCGYAGPAEPPY